LKYRIDKTPSNVVIPNEIKNLALSNFEKIEGKKRIGKTVIAKKLKVEEIT